ncbi:putative inactive histone-lysine N-methyltransferase SUVR2 [Citrus sinensis]|uniref:Inactive histone-lysine N-methyltransferase SUVR2 n=1 Tax=Citrus sinensis TaxID=2711 RepID=A0ACB8MH18_CITSI|nr:putative inactive histone-lysine N-methyltransferase SUVR2 [Citrus sinensis]
MAPDPKITKAFKAMKLLGISENKVKPVLKRLLKLYDKNWELIEGENYRVLADAIFEEEDNKVSEQKKPKIAEEKFEEESLEHEEPLRPLKRLRRGVQSVVPPSPSNSSPGFGGTLSRRPKMDGDELPASSFQQQSPEKTKSPKFNLGNVRLENHSYKGKEPVSPQVASAQNRASHALCIRGPTVEPGIVPSPKKVVPSTHVFIRPKDEPFTDDMFTDNAPQYEAPIAVIRPDSLRQEDSLPGNISVQEPVSQEPPASHHVQGEYRGDGALASLGEGSSNCKLAGMPFEFPPSLEIASSSMGEVKISLSCNSTFGRKNFHMPSLDELRELLEERCLRSYKIIDPSFSIMNLMKDVCNCFVELATNTSHGLQEELRSVTPNLDILKKSTAQDAILVGGSKENMFIPSGIRSGSAQLVPPQIPRPLKSLNGADDHVSTSEEIVANGVVESGLAKEWGDLEFSNLHSLVPVPLCRLTPDELRAIHDVKDITKGEERVAIPWVNEINNERPPSFYYISHSLVFQNACVNFSLSRIGDESCCSACFGNCLQSGLTCACAHQNGRFVYTPEGVLEEEFLEECISMTRGPQQQHLLNCRDCPLERSKNEGILEPCKGHLKRNIIKECWSKCGCYKQCGNRVVQRGVSKDKEALCLDATCYGNAARFLNHRCFDANLIEIPVQIETPEHHYYHVAFFTTREVDAFEELTWDYGIDFDDHDHLVKFRCRCGSNFCRNMKRSSTSARNIGIGNSHCLLLLVRPVPSIIVLQSTCLW